LAFHALNPVGATFASSFMFVLALCMYPELKREH
jgi:hypothetical protein